MARCILSMRFPLPGMRWWEWDHERDGKKTKQILFLEKKIVEILSLYSDRNMNVQGSSGLQWHLLWMCILQIEAYAFCGECQWIRKEWCEWLICGISSYIRFEIGRILFSWIIFDCSVRISNEWFSKIEKSCSKTIP